MRPMARLSTSRCQPIRAARRDDPAWLLLRPRSGVHASSDVSIWSGPWGRTEANLRVDGYAGLSKGESPWPSTAFTASSSSVSRHVATTDSDQRPADLPQPSEGHDRDGPDQLWVADITCVAIVVGFVYVAVILEAWSRRVVGYAISRSSHARLNRRPRGRDRATTPVSWMRASFGSSSQYASERYRDTLTAHALVGSIRSARQSVRQRQGRELHENHEGRGCISNGVQNVRGRYREPSPLHRRSLQ